MRNKLTFLLILLANTLMFAHAVIPHHHANGMVVDLFDVSRDSKMPHSSPCNHHNHDSSQHEGSGESCFIREIVVKVRSIDDELKVIVKLINPVNEGSFIESTLRKSTSSFFFKDSNSIEYFDNEGFPDYCSPSINRISFRGPPIA